MKSFTLSLKNFNNDMRDASGNAAIEQVIVEAKSKAGEKKLAYIAKNEDAYDIHDIEWMQNVHQAMTITGRKVIGYTNPIS